MAPWPYLLRIILRPHRAMVYFTHLSSLLKCESVRAVSYLFLYPETLIYYKMFNICVMDKEKGISVLKFSGWKASFHFIVSKKPHTVLQGSLGPLGTLVNIWRHFWLAQRGQGSMLLSSSWQTPEMLLCVAKPYNAQDSWQQGIIWTKMSIVTRLKHPALG